MNSKIYRCGWCGTPTDKNGKTLDENVFKRVVNIIEKYGDAHSVRTHGYCCGNQYI